MVNGNKFLGPEALPKLAEHIDLRFDELSKKLDEIGSPVDPGTGESMEEIGAEEVKTLWQDQ